MYGIKEIEDYWENNKGGSSPIFPVIEYFNVNGNLHSFEIFELFSSSRPEPVAIYSKPDSTLRILDQQGRIFNYVSHEDGFYFPKLTGEKLTLAMLKQIIEEMDENEFVKFLTMENFEIFVDKYCK